MEDIRPWGFFWRREVVAQIAEVVLFVLHFLLAGWVTGLAIT